MAWIRSVLERLTPARTDDDDTELRSLERRLAALDAQIDANRFGRRHEPITTGEGGHHAVR